MVKKRYVFGFVNGNLSVDGEGCANEGDGWFTFEEDNVDWHQYDEKSGTYLLVDVPRSELIELRDFLIQRFPLPNQGAEISKPLRDPRLDDPKYRNKSAD